MNNPLQYSSLENSTDRGACEATVHGVTESNMTEWLTLSLFNIMDYLKFLQMLLLTKLRFGHPTLGFSKMPPNFCYDHNVMYPTVKSSYIKFSYSL